MQITPLNLDSVLLLLHNSKLAYYSCILISFICGQLEDLIYIIMLLFLYFTIATLGTEEGGRFREAVIMARQRCSGRSRGGGPFIFRYKRNHKEITKKK